MRASVWRDYPRVLAHSSSSDPSLLDASKFHVDQGSDLVFREPVQIGQTRFFLRCVRQRFQGKTQTGEFLEQVFLKPFNRGIVNSQRGGERASQAGLQAISQLDRSQGIHSQLKNP